ncbi:MAG: hypothetical protein N2112_12115 [Gemmataceae bacterium]|nr:hypothetical protein [Gemmataceae bacterium]
MIPIATDLGPFTDVIYDRTRDIFVGLSQSGILLEWSGFDEPTTRRLPHSHCTKLAFTPNSAKGYVASSEGLSDLSSGKNLIAIPPQSILSHVFCLSDQLAVFGYSPEAYNRAVHTLWWIDLAKKTSRALDPVEMHAVTALTGIPRTRTFAWGNWERQLHIRDLTRPTSQHFNLKKPALSLCFNSSGKRLAVGCDWEILVFDVPKFPAPPLLIGRHQGVVQSLVFSANDRFLISGGSDKTVRIWDVDNQSLVHNYDWQIGRVGAVTTDTEGIRGCAVGSEGKMIIWDLDF